MKKNIKKLIMLLVFVALFLGICLGLQYILFDDVQSYSRLMMHDLYYADDNLDILFVGSSHVRRAFNTEVTDEVFGQNTFNLSTASQRLDGGLALIREAVSYYHISKIYLDMYYGAVDTEPYSTRTGLTETYLVSDYLRPSIHKYQFLLHASPALYYTNGILPFRRNWEKIYDIDYLKDLFHRKQEDTYKNYEWFVIDTHDYYGGNGYFSNTVTMPDAMIWSSMAYGSIKKHLEMPENSDWMKTLNEIVSLCRKKDIELTFMIVPEPEWTVTARGNYQDYSDWVRELAEKYQVPFYDFNLMKPEYLDASDGNLFFDSDHLNDIGSEKFSRVFAEFFTGQIKEEDLFFDSFNDKLLSEPPRVYGLAGPKNDEDGKRLGYVISNRENGMEYRISLTSADTGETTLLQDFSETKDFELPEGEKGTIEVRWRVEGEQETVAFTLEY